VPAKAHFHAIDGHCGWQGYSLTVKDKHLTNQNPRSVVETPGLYLNCRWFKLSDEQALNVRQMGNMKLRLVKTGYRESISRKLVIRIIIIIIYSIKSATLM
jgi:hypothetical protein